MQFQNPLLAVSDLERSKQFYREVLGLHVILDFGANVTLTGGICLQTKESWSGFLEGVKLTFGGRVSELYFEEDDFDGFLRKLEALPQIELVHPAKEHPWGQRAVRFYDPDHHIIEVGEAMKSVCLRFLAEGMAVKETAERMDVPVEYVNDCIRS